MKISDEVDEPTSGIPSRFYYYHPQRSLGQGNVLHRSVILFTGGAGGLYMMSLPGWLPGPMFLPGGSLSMGSLSRGICWGGSSLSGGGVCPGREVSAQAGSLSGRPSAR